MLYSAIGMRGSDVVARDGAPLGTLVDAYGNTMTDAIEVLIVDGSAAGGPIRLVPSSAVQEYNTDLRTLTLPGRWETNGAISNDIIRMVRFGLPADYYDTYASEVRALTVADLSDAADTVIQPGRLVWVIVGDRAVIEEGIQELGLGEIHYMDADGNELDAEGRRAE